MNDSETKAFHKLNISEPFDNLSLSNWRVKQESPTVPDDEKPHKEEPITQTSSSSPLIPKCIKEICSSPKSIELHVIYDAPTSQATYHYSVTWESDDDFEITEMSESTGKSCSSMVCGRYSPVSSKCDGPCQKEFPSNLLNTIGRCDHYLCTACFGLVKNSDGTNGCSSRQCFSKGSTSKEIKKNFEKGICRKQRSRARDMKERGIDVKSASAVSSYSGMSSKSSSTETDCSVISVTLSVVSTIPDFATAIPIEAHPKVKTMLVVVEPTEDYGIGQTHVELEMNPSVKLMDAIWELLYRKRKIFDDYVPYSSLYFAAIKSSEKVGMRRIEKKFWSSWLLMDVPKLGDRITLVLDMGGYVKKGADIYLK